jgi:endonuclease YncB( thermonuclease family)
MPPRARRLYVVLATVAALVAAAIPACPAHDVRGRPLWRVDMVHDGDTVTCLDENRAPRKIRLVGIDAPELDQPGGRESRAALVGKLAGGTVRVDDRGRDQHGRLLGTLYVGDRNVNRELVADGWAWVFDGFSPDPDLLDAESAARGARRGLWAAADPRRPADWRREHPSHR